MNKILACAAVVYVVAATGTAAAVDLVGVPIAGVKMVGLSSPDAGCTPRHLASLVPDVPQSVNLDCTTITVTVTGNSILVASTVPVADLNVSLEQVRFTAPDASGPVIPIVIRTPQPPAVLDRIIGMRGGDYARPDSITKASSNVGATVMVLAGDDVFVGVYEMILRPDDLAIPPFALFAATSAGSPSVDSDGDGEPDASDACPGTLAGTTVDAAGCSQPQYCASKVIDDFQSFLACAAADWKNDEPLVWAGDCHPISAGGSWSSFTCRAR